MSIPSNLSPLGMVGTGILPVGYMEADFLESTGTQYIDTGIVKHGNFTVELTYAQQQVNRISMCGYIYTHEGVSYCNTVGVDKINFLGQLRMTSTADTVLWPRPSNFDYAAKNTIVYTTGQNKVLLNDVSCNLSMVSTLKCDITNALNKTIHLFAYNGGRKEGYLKIYNFSLYEKGKSEDVKFIPALDPTGSPCMYDTVGHTAFKNVGTGQFIVGMNMGQARKLGKLPSTGGTLTVSLPWEAGVDAEVQDALAKAAEDGWTVMVQYREPEVATENINVDFLESTGTQYITDAVGLTLSEVEVICKFYPNDVYNAAVFGQRNSGYLNNLQLLLRSSRDVMFSVRTGSSGPFSPPSTNTMYALEYKGGVAKLNDEEKTVSDKPVNAEFPLYVFAQNSAGTKTNMFKGRIYYLDIKHDGVNSNLRPAIDTNGIPCMYNSGQNKSGYNAGTGSFIAGFESTEKAALGLAKLPVVEAGELTVSLPAAAQEEATRVPAAIEVARQRGWTIITQYRED